MKYILILYLTGSLTTAEFNNLKTCQNVITVLNDTMVFKEAYGVCVPQGEDGGSDVRD